MKRENKDEDIEERIFTIKESDKGFKTEIELDDGSRIKFLDEDDSVQSFYIKESLYSQFVKQVDLIIKKMK